MPVALGSFQQAAGCPDAPGVNLVANPGFETPDSGASYIFYSANFGSWDVTQGSSSTVSSHVRM